MAGEGTCRGIRVLTAAAVLSMVGVVAMLPGATAQGPGQKLYVPQLSADGADLSPALGCPGDPNTYFDQAGVLRRVEGFEVHDQDTDLAMLLFEFTNPCNQPIAPLPLVVRITGGDDASTALLGGFPSVVAPGERGFYSVYLNSDVLAAAGIDPGSQPWTWEELADVARKLTVDASGNDADSPDFDPTSVAQLGAGGSWSVTARHSGSPVAWPPFLWLEGLCPDGSTAIGRFFPDAYGYNAGGATRFDGRTSWMGACTPLAVTNILGPSIDEQWLDRVIGGAANTILPGDVTLFQTDAGHFDLALTFANTNTVAGVPSNVTIRLNRQDAGQPFQFTVPQFDTYYPGELGRSVIRNVPGVAGDYSSVVVDIGNTTAATAVILGWATPASYRLGDDPFAAYFGVWNSWAILPGPGTVVARNWWQHNEELFFIAGGPSFPAANPPPYFGTTVPVEQVENFNTGPALDIADEILSRSGFLATTVGAGN